MTDIDHLAEAKNRMRLPAGSIGFETAMKEAGNHALIALVERLDKQNEILAGQLHRIAETLISLVGAVRGKSQMSGPRSLDTSTNPGQEASR